MLKELSVIRKEKAEKLYSIQFAQERHEKAVERVRCLEMFIVRIVLRNLSIRVENLFRAANCRPTSSCEI